MSKITELGKNPGAHAYKTALKPQAEIALEKAKKQKKPAIFIKKESA